MFSKYQSTCVSLSIFVALLATSCSEPKKQLPEDKTKASATSPVINPPSKPSDSSGSPIKVKTELMLCSGKLNASYESTDQPCLSVVSINDGKQLFTSTPSVRAFETILSKNNLSLSSVSYVERREQGLKDKYVYLSQTDYKNSNSGKFGLKGDFNQYCDYLNQMNFAGKRDWRRPTMEELIALHETHGDMKQKFNWPTDLGYWSNHVDKETLKNKDPITDIVNLHAANLGAKVKSGKQYRSVSADDYRAASCTSHDLAKLDNGVISHRGSPDLYVESSMYAYRQNMKHGVVNIEPDVWEIRNGELVVAHDWSTLRLFNNFLLLGFTTSLRDIERLRFKSTVPHYDELNSAKGFHTEYDYKMPTFKAFLVEFMVYLQRQPDAVMYPETKNNASGGQAMLNMFKKFEVPVKNVVVQSFSQSNHIKLLDAGYKGSAGYNYDNPDRLHKNITSVFMNLNQCNRQSRITRLKAKGLEVIGYTLKGENAKKQNWEAKNKECSFDKVFSNNVLATTIKK